MIPSSQRVRKTRTFGIMCLALSLVHSPLPWPDFHNVRHHDGTGEICANHEHLLRWHPDAKLAEDVAMLHWHWFVPLDGGSVPANGHDGLTLHASAPEWPCGSLCEHRNSVSTPCEITQALTGVIRTLTNPDVATIFSLQPDPPPKLRLGAASLLTCYSATFRAHASLPTLLQRWTC